MADRTSDRWLEVDDTDSRIQYSGEWFSDSYTTPGRIQASGDLNKGTARGTNTAGVLTFQYQGGDVSIWGPVSQIPTSATTIRCTVDGVVVPSPRVSSIRKDWYPLCVSRTHSVGQHNVVLNVTSTDGTAVWVDTIAHFSPGGADLVGQHSQIPPSSPAMKYLGEGWGSQWSNGERMTNVGGSKLAVSFYGISVELRGFLEHTMPRTSSPATYSIDGGPATPFTIPTYSDGLRAVDSDAVRWRVPFLVTPPVENGNHTVEITYNGNADTVPLSVDYVLVAHEGAQVNPTLSPTPLGGVAGGRNLGPLLGGIFAGLLLLLLLLLALCLRRRRRDSRSEIAYANVHVEEEEAQDPPFIPPPIIVKEKKGKGEKDEKSWGKGSYAPMVDLDEEEYGIMEAGGQLYDPYPSRERPSSMNPVPASLGLAVHADSGIRLTTPHAPPLLVVPTATGSSTRSGYVQVPPQYSAD